MAAWVNFAAEQGFARVVLVGQSARWPAVAAVGGHVARVARLVGLVLASGSGATRSARPTMTP